MDYWTIEVLEAGDLWHEIARVTDADYLGQVVRILVGPQVETCKILRIQRLRIPDATVQ